MWTEKQIKNKKPELGKSRSFIRIENFLYVDVRDTGAKTWFFRKVSGGKEWKEALGNCDKISLYEARRLREQKLMNLSATKDSTESLLFRNLAEE